MIAARTGFESAGRCTKPVVPCEYGLRQCAHLNGAPRTTRASSRYARRKVDGKKLALAPGGAGPLRTSRDESGQYRQPVSGFEASKIARQVLAGTEKVRIHIEVVASAKCARGSRRSSEARTGLRNGPVCRQPYLLDTCAATAPGHKTKGA